MERIYKHNAPDWAHGVQPFERHLLEEQTSEILLPEEDLDDLDPQALREQVLAQALSEARGAAEQKVHEAYEEGLRRGMAEGKQRFEESIAQCTGALLEAAGALQRAHQEFLEALEPQVFDLVCLIAERVLGREVRADKDLILTTVRRALECLTNEEKLRIRINPADMNAMKQHRVTLLEEFEGVKHIEVAADEQVAPGGCLVDGMRLHVDARLETLLAHVINEMAD